MTERDSAEAKAAGGDSKQQEAELLWQVERLQRQSEELSEEREVLLKDISLLKGALEKIKERGIALFEVVADVAADALRECLRPLPLVLPRASD